MPKARQVINMAERIDYAKASQGIATTAITPTTVGAAMIWANGQYDREDEAALHLVNMSPEWRANAAKTAMLSRRMDALRMLLTTLPCATLTDAVYQLSAIVEEADHLATGHEGDPGEAGTRLLRVLCTTLPVLVEAAGLDMRAVAWSGVRELSRINHTEQDA